MGWSGDFVETCDRRDRAPAYIVESLPATSSPGWDFGRSWGAATNRGLGYKPVLQSVQWTPPTLNPVGWTTTMGGFSFVLTEWRNAMEDLRRGHIIVLRMGFSGWAESEFQVVTFGRLRGARIQGATCVVAVDGPDSLFVSRQATSETRSRFFRAVSSTTIASNYVTSDTSLVLTSASGFSRQTSGTGVVRVTPNTGSDFYLTWTGVSGNTLTVDAAHRFGTNRNDANAGKAVTECAYLYGHPHTILRKILTSTGDGSNGTYDSLPITWGVGLPQSYVGDDIGIWKDRYEPGSGAAVDFDFVIDPNIEVTSTIERDRYGVPYVAKTSSLPEDTGSALDIVRKLNTVGIWTTLRQGQITVRSVTPATRYTMDTFVTETIRDDDVAEVISIEPWDQRVPACYRTVEVTDGTVTKTYERSDGPNHLPVIEALTIDVSQFIFKTGSTRTDIFTLIAEWVGTWATQMPGVVRLRVRRWKAAVLTLGDIVALDISRGGATFENVPGMVTGITLFDGASSTIEIIFPEGTVAGAVS